MPVPLLQVSIPAQAVGTRADAAQHPGTDTLADTFPQLLSARRPPAPGDTQEPRIRPVAPHWADSPQDEQASSENAAEQLIALLAPVTLAHVSSQPGTEINVPRRSVPATPSSPLSGAIAPSGINPLLASASPQLANPAASAHATASLADGGQTPPTPGGSLSVPDPTLLQPAGELPTAIPSDRQARHALPRLGPVTRSGDLDPELSNGQVTLPLAGASSAGSADASQTSTLPSGLISPVGTGPSFDSSAPLASGSLATPPTQPGFSLPAHGGPAPLLATPLGHPGWGQALAQQFGQVIHLGTPGLQQAELRLDPPDLGPLRVTLHIQDNVAHAWFISPHASVRHAVESALPQLAQQLADAGLSLGEAHVGSEQAGHQDSHRAHSPRPSAVTAHPQASDLPPTDRLTQSTSPDRLSRIDTYV